MLMTISCQSHEGSPNKWGLLRSCLVGSETCQGCVPQGHWSCNRWQHHYERCPNKWGMLRSCLRGSKTSQGRDPQSHECSPINWGLLMSQGSSCCNRCQHLHEGSPIKGGLLMSCPGGSKASLLLLLVLTSRQPQALP